MPMRTKVALLVLILLLGGYSCVARRPVPLPQPIIRYGCENGWALAGKTCYIHLSSADAKKVSVAIGSAGDVSIFSAACAAEEPGIVVCKKPATVQHIAPGKIPQAME